MKEISRILEKRNKRGNFKETNTRKRINIECDGSVPTPKTPGKTAPDQ